MSYASSKKYRGALKLLSFLPVLALLAFTTGCEGDGDGGGSDADHDFGTRDPSKCAVVGDSIAIGYGAAGPSWPVRLSGKLERPVANYGVPGMRMTGGMSVVHEALAGEAGYIIVALGANDAITGQSSDAVKGNLSAMIAAIRAADAVPVVGNVVAMAGPREVFNPAVTAINAGIKEVCGAEKVLFVNLKGSVSTSMLQADGLHPDNDGQEAIAKAFYGKLKGRVQ